MPKRKGYITPYETRCRDKRRKEKNKRKIENNMSVLDKLRRLKKDNYPEYLKEIRNKPTYL